VARDYNQAANRLHHLSMRYVGAVFEVASGTPVSLLPSNHPGIREMRDLIDCVLLSRAEINGFTRILVEAKLLTIERAEQIFAEEYQWLEEQKAKFLGVEVSDAGLVIKRPEV
jgi:hypothetical protein